MKEDASDMDIDIPVDEDYSSSKPTEESAKAASEETKAEDSLDRKIEDAEKRAEEAERKLADADEKYIRLCAEYDNYRKRTSKEKLEIFSDSTIKCVAEIIPVIDNFERAIDAECNDESFKNGMKMIYNQLLDTLKKLGVTEMDALGSEFNPNIHNAIKQVEDENFGENTVCEVFQKGYMLNDKVIRHAVVAVAN